jgi:hypothetical protein
VKVLQPLRGFVGLADVFLTRNIINLSLAKVGLVIPRILFFV